MNQEYRYIHHVDDLVDAIEHTAQAKVIFLPQYSPDLIPLEEAFSKVKYLLKANDSASSNCCTYSMACIVIFHDNQG